MDASVSKISKTPSDSPPEASTVKKLVSIAALTLIMIGAAAAFYRYDRYGRYQQKTNDATIEADQVTISSKLAGYVKAVAASENQQVTKGTLLVEIDPLDYDDKLQAAEAEVAAAAAGEQSTNASKSEAEAEVERAQAGLMAAKATLDYSEREVARYKPLVAEGGAPVSTLSQLREKRDLALADVAAQQAGVSAAKSRTEVVAAKAVELAAQTNVLRATRVAAANDLSSTRLTAPITGRIASRTVRVGQYVQPGARLLTVVPSESIYVVANFKETQVGLMHPGQAAKIHVDALPKMEFSGVVESISPGTGANFSLIPPQNATGNFTKIVQRVPVRIRIDAGPVARRILVPGLSSSVEVNTLSGHDDLQAISAEQKREKR